ncbi:MAG: TIGR04283 family arsenosugar biosynthesis glycosyltransferase [Sphingomonadaceae bacterium]
MISAIVPALDEAAHIEACLGSLAPAGEIIVADGGSRDGTREMARTAGARLIDGSPGRGLQLARGAQAAQGDWLLFVHADTVLGADWPREAERHIARHPGKAGFFGFRLDDPSRTARIMEWGNRQRVRLFGLPYGDQGLLVRRALYEKIGGFRPLPLMEDVDIVRRIGRRRLRRLDADAITSAERWRRDGWWRRWAGNQLCMALYVLGVPPDRIARIYERSRL